MNYSEPVVLSPHPDPLPKGEGGKLNHDFSLPCFPALPPCDIIRIRVHAPLLFVSMEGQLSRHPLAELIREIIDSELSGALRLSREAAKVAVYFDSGQPIFAASNLRAHRLSEILKRQQIKSAHLENAPAAATDEELSQTLI